MYFLTNFSSFHSSSVWHTDLTTQACMCMSGSNKPERWWGAQGSAPVTPSLAPCNVSFYGSTVLPVSPRSPASCFLLPQMMPGSQLFVPPPLPHSWSLGFPEPPFLSSLLWKTLMNFLANPTVLSPRVFADDARGWQSPFVLCLHPQGCLREGSGPRVLFTEEPGGLQSMGLQRVGHD